MCLVSSVCIGVAFAFYSKNMILSSADERLLSAAEFTYELLGEDYHDHITDEDSLSHKEFMHILDRHDDLCRRLNLQYLWSVLVLDDKTVFTSATRSDVNDPTSEHASFFEPHGDPDAFSPAMGTPDVPVYSSFHNEWGEGRMILVPRLDTEGRRYIIGASIQLEELNSLIFNTVLLALMFGGVLFGFIWLITNQLARRITNIFARITSAAMQMKDGNLKVDLPVSSIVEAQQLCEALNYMRHELRQRIEELEMGNKVLSIMAKGEELPEVLASICCGCEMLDDSICASVLLFDPERQVLLPGAAPNLPGDFNDLMKHGLPISHDEGIRGVAAFTRKLAMTTDIPGDACSTPCQSCMEKIRQHGFNACWSMPILSSNGTVLGSMVNYSKQAGEPTDENLRVLKWAANMSAMAIEKNQAEERVRQSESKLSSILNNSWDVIWSVSWPQIDNIFFISPSVESLYGITPSELMKNPDKWINAIHSEDTVIADRAIAELKATGYAEYECRIIRSDGKTRWVHNRCCLVMNDEGIPQRLDGIMSDITERKKVEDKIRAINKQLQQVNAEKDKLFAIIAHDLKSPLSGVFSTSQILSKGSESLSSEEISYISTEMHKSSKNALGLLNDLMQWARMSQGGIDFSPEICSLDELAKSSLNTARDVADKKGISIDCNVPQDIEVLVDQPMINTVIRNIICNSVKFTNPGGNISVTARNAGSDVEVCVQDDGIGMNDSVLSCIFTSDKNKRQYGTDGEKGTCLGLILCKEFVEKHGGRIWVESEPGKGTKVCFTLPAAS